MSLRRTRWKLRSVELPPPFGLADFLYSQRRDCFRNNPEEPTPPPVNLQLIGAPRDPRHVGGKDISEDAPPRPMRRTEVQEGQTLPGVRRSGMYLTAAASASPAASAAPSATAAAVSPGPGASSAHDATTSTQHGRDGRTLSLLPPPDIHHADCRVMPGLQVYTSLGNNRPVEAPPPSPRQQSRTEPTLAHSRSGPFAVDNARQAVAGPSRSRTHTQQQQTQTLGANNLERRPDVRHDTAAAQKPPIAQPARDFGASSERLVDNRPSQAEVDVNSEGNYGGNRLFSDEQHGHDRYAYLFTGQLDEGLRDKQQPRLRRDQEPEAPHRVGFSSAPSFDNVENMNPHHYPDDIPPRRAESENLQPPRRLGFSNTASSSSLSNQDRRRQETEAVRPGQTQQQASRAPGSPATVAENRRQLGLEEQAFTLGAPVSGASFVSGRCEEYV